MSLSIISVCAIGAMFLFAAIGFYASWSIIKEIRIYYPNIYDEIGRPDVCTRMSIYREWRFNLFVLRREYSSISNKKIKRLGDAALLCACVNAIIFIYLLFFRYNEFGGNYPF